MVVVAYHLLLSIESLFIVIKVDQYGVQPFVLVLAYFQSFDLSILWCVIECYDPPQFFSSIPVTPATTPPPAPAPPAIQPIPVQPVALPQPYIRTRPLSPMQVDPANVPLPTPSTDSDMLPPDQAMPASPRTRAFVEHLQGQIVHQATTGERGRTTTRATQDLCDALADMFGLPPLPIPQASPARSPSPMAAISTSQLHCDESCHSPSAPSIPATRPHSPEPEAGPSK